MAFVRTCGLGIIATTGLNEASHSPRQEALRTGDSTRRSVHGKMSGKLLHVPPVNHNVTNMNEASGKDAGPRDSLARDGTCLANERTLLAYMRTADHAACLGDNVRQTLRYGPLAADRRLPPSAHLGRHGALRICAIQKHESPHRRIRLVPVSELTNA